MKINQNEDGKQNKFSPKALQGCSSWMWLGWLLLFGLVFWGFPALRSRIAPTNVSYSEFRRQVRAGNVDAITVEGQEIRGEFINPIQQSAPTEQDQDQEPEEITQFVTHVPSFGDDALMELLDTYEVEINTQVSADIPWSGILLGLLPLLILGVFFYFSFSRMRSQGQNILSIGKSGAKLYDRRKEKTTFDDVAGAKGAKNELQEIVEYLKSPDKFQKLGGEVPTGVILVGPPGTGKTLLARAVAGEAEVPFFSITGSNFMEMFVGVGASRVRDLFSEAKKAAPSIIFIDELDSIGRRRGAGLGGGHDEREQTLNQLLSEMDGFEPNEKVIVMAATNRPDILDLALLRPGRFDRRISVDLPTMHDRQKILEIHARNKPLAEDVNLERMARGTPGFSGADLENLLNEAALTAAAQDKDKIEREDIEKARDRILLGLERESLALTDQECRMLAYHEGGHAVVAAVVPNADPIHKVTIVPRGKAMGVTQQLPERDKYIFTREYLQDRLAVMMGGRAAEEIVFETSTSGAENDLKQATQLARRMVLDWGMSERFKQIAFGGRREHVFLGEEIAQGRDYSEHTGQEVDREIYKILSSAYETAVTIVRENRAGLDRLADVLLEEEELPGDEVLEIINPDPVAVKSS